MTVEAREQLRGALEGLAGLDWDDVVAVEGASRPLLERLKDDSGLLGGLLGGSREDARLRELSEHYDILDKVVLYDDSASGFRLRLHVFLPGYFDRPHNHRWSYSSLILRGAYQHFIYGSEEGLSEETDVSALRPRMVRTESVGSSYTLDHSMVHAVVAEPYTVSLILRGPARKDRFLVMDRQTNKAWWQYGASDETEQERDAKRMDDARFDETVSRLRELGVI
ncbi:MAG TPA: hypothetical protein VHR18_09875 [Solirubrobacterales bacterium]|jgi:hypothetical protein|nr:hypothetical protein [Solirubrobacterales bacterium]